MIKRQQLVTIGIPTYEAGQSLIVTLKSIYNQSAFNRIERIILAVDGNTISKNIINEIEHKKLEIHYFRKRKGQSGRINDICRLATTKLLILTNDDIILEETAIQRMIEDYEKTNSDLLAGTVKPLHSATLFEKALETGVLINNLISQKWNKGDNYLSVNGRLIMLSHALYKKIQLPENLWNNDAYIYIFAKLNNFSFGKSRRAIAYFKQPTNLSDHLSQSKKFQNSYVENQKYFKARIQSYYQVPTKLQLAVLPFAFIENPQSFVLYFATFIFTRIDNIMNKKALHKVGFWPTDISTKMLRFFA